MQLILRRADVEKATGLGRSTIYLLMSRGEFPRPIPLTETRVGWLAAEIDEWVRERAARRDLQGA